VARAIQAESQTKAPELRTDSLLEIVPRISPDLESPVWLAPYANVLERAVLRAQVDGSGDVRVVVAAPPQHGKTELTLRALIWWAIQRPGLRHAYITYNQDRAEEVSRQFTLIAEAAGLRPEGNLAGIRLKGGTTIRFTSVNGSLTGFAVDGVAVIDDPIKGPVEAQSAIVRKRAVEFFDSVVFIRRHPGTSFVVMATRWHPEDLSGVLIKRGWPYINLKAIAEGEVNEDGTVEGDPLGRLPGEALWPQRKPPEFFDSERKNAFWWAALFQGEPRPRGGNVFGEPGMYSRLPVEGYRGAYGLDLAYSAKTHADWSICVEIWRVDPGRGAPPVFYVVDVQRKQVSAPEFALTLKAKHSARPFPMRWYAAGTEKGSADFLKSRGIPISAVTPRGDKFARAQSVAAAWNDGRVMVPDPEHVSAPWLPDFLTIVQGFTGVHDTHDDDVEALAAGFDELNGRVIEYDPRHNLSLPRVRC
jgi:predicted phage terminase large subunit-like protein